MGSGSNLRASLSLVSWSKGELKPDLLVYFLHFGFARYACLTKSFLFSHFSAARSSHGIVIEEGGRLQAAAVEFPLGADFEVFRVPRGGIRFLQALWGKYGSCSSYFSRGVHVGSSLLTLLCCVLAHMEHTRLGDITEVHILEWKAVVQEAIEGGFKFGFILDYLRRLARDIFSRRVLAELREAEAPCCCFEGCFECCCTEPMGLGFCQKGFCRSSY
uniref:Uncharacterized protein n=1 Tax=Fagus sylvatica TaxID=28930 RepID=A0A2N9EZQ9_FAGSY